MPLILQSIHVWRNMLYYANLLKRPSISKDLRKAIIKSLYTLPAFLMTELFKIDNKAQNNQMMNFSEQIYTDPLFIDEKTVSEAEQYRDPTR